MIDKVTGKIIQLSESVVILDIGAIALSIQVPNGFAYQGKTEISLWTFLQWHQDQGPLLYGFSTLLERSMFALVIDCSGIGPKIGLSLLRHINCELLITFIQTNNHEGLSKVPGIGQKKAEQLIVQARHKVQKLFDIPHVNNPYAQHLSEITQTLNSLHYSQKEVSAALDHLYKQNMHMASFDQLLRTALSFLTKKSSAP